MMTKLHPIKVTVNGQVYERQVEARLLLSDFLRHDLGLMGTHVGCEHGMCGACTIIFDGEPVRSCLIFAVQADGHEIKTVESLGTLRKCTLCKRLFRKNTVCSAVFAPRNLDDRGSLPGREPNPNEDEIREAIDGNICRCTGYEKIIESVQAAAQKMSSGK
jgi:carbon-monoxide dehydrogenase small subunit